MSEWKCENVDFEEIEYFLSLNPVVDAIDSDNGCCWFKFNLLRTKNNELEYVKIRVPADDFFVEKCPDIVECHGYECGELNRSKWCISCEELPQLRDILGLQAREPDEYLRYNDVKHHVDINQAEISYKLVTNKSSLCSRFNGTRRKCVLEK